MADIADIPELLDTFEEALDLLKAVLATEPNPLMVMEARRFLTKHKVGEAEVSKAREGE